MDRLAEPGDRDESDAHQGPRLRNRLRLPVGGRDARDRRCFHCQRSFPVVPFEPAEDRALFLVLSVSWLSCVFLNMPTRIEVTDDCGTIVLQSVLRLRTDDMPPTPVHKRLGLLGPIAESLSVACRTPVPD